jgi:hypothetical protein
LPLLMHFVCLEIGAWQCDLGGCWKTYHSSSIRYKEKVCANLTWYI